MSQPRFKPSTCFTTCVTTSANLLNMYIQYYTISWQLQYTYICNMYKPWDSDSKIQSYTWQGYKCSDVHAYCTELWTIPMTLGATLTSVNNSLHISQLNRHASVPTHWCFFRSCFLAMTCYKYNIDMVTPTISPSAAECITKHMTGMWTLSTMYALMDLDLL
jgi:hypothetical protein